MTRTDRRSRPVRHARGGVANALYGTGVGRLGIDWRDETTATATRAARRAGRRVAKQALRTGRIEF